jgi:preprotein translocase subunit SecE
VSRDIAGSNSAPLWPELFHTSVYKATQGRIVRQLTALAIWIIVTLGCWRLYGTLVGSFESAPYLVPGIPGALLVAGLWFGYRVVNWSRFADFLIAVEAEMNKVTWPSKDELTRASIVVMFTIFFLAIALFVFDVVWQQVFTLIGVTS